MAQTGFTPIQLYYSTTAAAVPSAGNLAFGELAINITDGKLFYKDNLGVVQEISGGGGGGVTSFSAGTTGLTPNTATTGAVTLAGTLDVDNGGTGQTTYTDGQLLIGNSTGNTLTKATLTAGTGISITNGAGSITIASSSGFAAGTRLAFQQTSAPTGWTKDTTAALDDSIMRIVTGSVSSGGSTAFSTFNGQTATGATTLSTSEIPSHTHPNGGNSNSTSLATGGVANTRATYATTTGATGGGGSHTHSITTAIKYYDFIIASKD